MNVMFHIFRNSIIPSRSFHRPIKLVAFVLLLMCTNQFELSTGFSSIKGRNTWQSDFKQRLVKFASSSPNSEEYLSNLDSLDHSGQSKTNKKNRKLELSWCNDNQCILNEHMRETVTYDNEITFDGPATGQVVYSWEKQNDNEIHSVLILVKRDDDELMLVAAEAVKQLTSYGVRVVLAPDVAAKLRHYFGVDNDMIKLFEPRPVPGFGGNHLTGDGSISFGMSAPNADSDPDPDIICTLGGDGLLMYTGLVFQGPVPPILCVAGGSLGFLTPFSKQDMVPAIKRSLGLIKQIANEPGKEYTDPIIQGEHSALSSAVCISMRMRLECTVVNKEGIVRARFNVLNEVTINRGSCPYLANLECFCDNVHLTTVQADGIIFATPTGSTAYSMAAGGSVVHPAVPAILVTPICPHVLSFRSMVFPDHVTLRCCVPDEARATAFVSFDGKYHRELLRGDSVEVKMSAHPVPTINRMDHSSDWLNALKTNFNFNSRVIQKPF